MDIKHRRLAASLALFLPAALALAGCATVASGPPPQLVLAPSVDLSRYAGNWYIIAEIPYIGERGNVGGRAIYTPLPDGRIDDRYLAFEKSFAGKAEDKDFKDRVVAGSHNAEWRVPVVWPITVDYPILHVAPDYAVALVGYPDRSLGWVFARSPDMSDAAYHEELARFAAQGYDTSRFVRVAQHPDQIGRPGFY